MDLFHKGMDHGAGMCIAGGAEDAVGAAQCGYDAGCGVGVAQQLGAVEGLAVFVGSHQEIVTGIEEGQHFQIGDVLFFLKGTVTGQVLPVNGGYII